MGWRAINDTVGHSESLAAVSDLAERLYWRLVAHSDPYGRIPASPSKTRAMCFPLLNVTHAEVGEALSELERVKRILAYEVDGVAVIQLIAFEENQPKEFIRRRGASRLPECPTLKSGSTPEFLRSLYKLPAHKPHSGSTPEQVGSSPATREEKRRKELNTAAAALQPARDPQPDQATDAAAVENQERTIEDLEALGLTGTAIQLAQSDPRRAQAWLDLAHTEAQRNPAGFIIAGLKSGDWPSNRQAARKHRDPVERAQTLIRNLGPNIYDPITLDVEFDEIGVPQPDRAALHDLADTLRKQDAA